MTLVSEVDNKLIAFWFYTSLNKKDWHKQLQMDVMITVKYIIIKNYLEIKFINGNQIKQFLQC